MTIEKLNNWLTKSKIFAIFLIAFLAGVFLAGLIDFDQVVLKIFVSAIALLLATSFFFLREKIVVVFALAACCLLLGAVYHGWYQEKHTPYDLPYGQEVSFEGLVVEEPDIREGKIKLTIRTMEQWNPSTELRAGNEAIRNQKLLVSLPRYPEYQYGDKLKIAGKLEKPGEFSGFDYGAYLARYQIFAIINQTTNVEYVGSGYGNKIYSAMYWLKNKFKIAIEKSLTEPTASLGEGLVVGAKGGFSAQLKDQMQKTGTTHIVVISGQNMEIVAKVFTNLTQYWPRFFSFGTGVTGLILFTILTGASPSVVRAAILASLFLLARLVGRRKNIFNPLIFAGFIMVLINPFILRYDLGFQLSFMAMMGLIFVSPIFDNWMTKWPKIIREALSATLGAQVATLPIILFNFGRLAILAPLTNALILTVVPYAMLAGFIVGLAGLIWLPLGQLFGYLAWPLLKYIIVIIELFSQIPFASIDVDFKNWIWVVVYYGILTLIIFLLNKKSPDHAKGG